MGDSEASVERSAESKLAGIAPLTAEAIIRRRSIGTKVPKEATHEECFASKNKEATVVDSSYNLDVCESKVTQRQLDTLRTRFRISSAIMMKALAPGELPPIARENKNEIAFPTVALKCGVKLPLTPFVR